MIEKERCSNILRELLKAIPIKNILGISICVSSILFNVFFCFSILGVLNSSESRSSIAYTNNLTSLKNIITIYNWKRVERDSIYNLKNDHILYSITKSDYE